MSVYSFRFLRADVETEQFFLLGFPLSLCDRERTILLALLQNHPLSPSELVSGSMKRKLLSVYVGRINKKAEAISGRKLILSTDDGYDLNPTM